MGWDDKGRQDIPEVIFFVYGLARVRNMESIFHIHHITDTMWNASGTYRLIVVIDCYERVTQNPLVYPAGPDICQA
jgi:hypothetical protein